MHIESCQHGEYLKTAAMLLAETIAILQELANRILLEIFM
jgi:hypothetical protein